MADCCSAYCKKFVECGMLGITDYMKVIPKHPSEMDKNWCESFEDGEDE